MKALLLSTYTVAIISNLLIMGCSNTDATRSQVPSKPPAYVLAAFDAGQTISDDDPRVSRYSDLLNQIRAKCSNPPQEISDVTIDVLTTLQRKGVQIDTYELLKRINDAIPPVADGVTYDFRQVASAFKVLGAT